MMQTRRHFLSQTAAFAGAGVLSAKAAAAQDVYDQTALLDFWDVGALTLLHFSDLADQLLPHYHRPATTRVSIRAEQGQMPHLTGEALRIRYGLGGRTHLGYAHTAEEFETLAGYYGPMGGVDRLATLITAIRAKRPEALVLGGGGAFVGGLLGAQTQGEDMQAVLRLLGPDVMALGPDAALGAARLEALTADLPCQMLGAGGLKSATPVTLLRRANTVVAVVDVQRGGQADSAALFRRTATHVRDVRAAGAEVVVCLSQLGFAADRVLAQQVAGIDVICSGGHHLALPEPERVGETLILGSGGQGRFLTRLDLEVKEGRITDLEHGLIPVFADLVTPDPAMAATVAKMHKAYAAELTYPLGAATQTLSREGTFSASWDDLLLASVMQDQQAQIALAPAGHGGPTVRAGQTITRADVYAVTRDGPRDVVCEEVTGAKIRALLETSAEACFGRDTASRTQVQMIRAGGVSFKVNPDAATGKRITDLRLLSTGARLRGNDSYRTAAWGGLIEGASQGMVQDRVARTLSATSAQAGLTVNAITRA